MLKTNISILLTPSASKQLTRFLELRRRIGREYVNLSTVKTWAELEARKAKIVDLESQANALLERRSC